MSDFEELKTRLGKCLTELKGKSKTLSALNNRYAEKHGVFIPYKNYGFSTLFDFLVSIPDVIQVTQGGSLDGVKLTAVVPGKKEKVPITEKTTTGATKEPVTSEPTKQAPTATLRHMGQVADSPTDTVSQSPMLDRYLDLNELIMPGFLETTNSEFANYTQSLTVDLLKGLENLGLAGSKDGSSGPTSGKPVAAHDPSIKPLSNVEREELLKQEEKKKEEKQAGPVPVDLAKVPSKAFKRKKIAPAPNIPNLVGCNICRNTDVLDLSCPNCGRMLLMECEALPSPDWPESHTSYAQASGSCSTTNRSLMEVQQHVLAARQLLDRKKKKGSDAVKYVE